MEFDALLLLSLWIDEPALNYDSIDFASSVSLALDPDFSAPGWLGWVGG